MAMIAGTGMTYKGDRKGPLAIADEIGLDCVLEELEQISSSTASASGPPGCSARRSAPGISA